MTSPVGADNGGSPIISYSLEWDAGSGGVSFIPLTGLTSNNILLSYTQTGLSAGSAYLFRYRTLNIFGWGPYSSVLQAIAAELPD
jgi:hypothetical protein